MTISLEASVDAVNNCLAQNSSQQVNSSVLEKNENLYAELRLQFTAQYALALAEYKAAESNEEKEKYLERLAVLRLISDRMQTSTKGMAAAVQRLASGQDPRIRAAVMAAAKEQLDAADAETDL